jgi:hypothetical protein
LSETTRIAQVFTFIQRNDIVSYFRSDPSSNHRLSSLYFSVKGFIDNYFLPNGYSYWPEYEYVQKNMSEFFWFGRTERIMSLYGSLLFELGLFSFFVIFLINFWLSKFINIMNLKKYKISIYMFFNIIFLTALPISTPFIGFFLAIFVIKGNVSHLSKTQKYDLKLKSS